MPHYLCLTDLTAANSKREPSTEASNEGCTSDATAAAASKEDCAHPVAVLALEENKKSSFALQQSYALHSASKDIVPCSPTSARDSIVVDDDNSGGDEEANGQPAPADEANSVDDNSIAGNESAMKKQSLTCEASITSHASSGDETPQFTPDHARETFLFGGFELISNAKSVEVHVVRLDNTTAASRKGEEAYMTTCKGIPARELPPLGAPALYLDGTMPRSDRREENQGEESVITEEDSFYKFILVSPGGPKPVERVRLKLLRSNTSYAHGSIIVRSLKVKGRLSDSIPSSNSATQQSMEANPMVPTGAANNYPRPMQNDVSGLASMMAMMGGRGALETPTPVQMQMYPQQQLGPMQMQTANPLHQQMQQQQYNQQQEKYQAEIMSSIAGLGMFLKSSEEQMMRKLEAMLTGMETRITKRLDGLEERLGAMEEKLKSEDELDELSDTFHENE